jgi:alcohol dehydrogenase class IV
LRDFHYISYAQEVIFGHAALTRMEEAMKHFGWHRLMLCANRSMRSNGHAAAVEGALGDRLVAVFDVVQPHVQDVQVDEALALAAANDVDAIIGLGGGSPIGMAKAVAYTLEDAAIKSPRGQLASPTAQPMIPVVAIPTTYAGSEMTAVFGITHSREPVPRKVTTYDPKIAPKMVVYDPQLTLDLPPELTASSGINALAHCFEALYSVTRHPLSTAAALSGIKKISNSLLSCFQDGGNLQARTEMLAGAHLAGLSLASVAMGLHHGLCHVLGGVAGVPHGIANSIILPHAIRFNADAASAELLPAAEAMGLVVDGQRPVAVMDSVAEQVSGLVREMKLPQRLREVGVKQADLKRLAQLAFQNQTVQNNPKRIQDAGQIEGLLQAAW